MSNRKVSLSGMPYVPGTACGTLRQGMTDDAAGCIVMLDASLPGPFAPLPAGFIVVDGAPFSHAMISILGLGVPTVIVNRAQAQELEPGSTLMLDGGSGWIMMTDAADCPDMKPVSSNAPVSIAASATTDGTRISLRVSARNKQAIRRAVQSGAEAIGLVRSEFIEPDDGRPPDAAFYHAAFRDLCEAAGGLPVTIRLLDIAADKHPSWLSPESGAGGALGLQGVRLYHDEPLRGLVLAQLEAISALAADYKLRVLLPYVADCDELEYWVDVLRQSLPGEVPLGAMAETPAAALQIGRWLEVVDFAGLGCNDLMQCLFGADRDRPELLRYLDPHAPALYRFLRDVVMTGGESTGRIQLCGVLPQLPGILPVLLGLGFRVFSVEASLLQSLGHNIGTSSLRDCKRLAERICAATSSREVRSLLGMDVSPFAEKQA
jgi:phosphoenolpyruvate-protein kinase (PTS system EI component)